MSLFGTLDRSTSSSTLLQTGPRSLFTFLCPAIRHPRHSQTIQRRHQSHIRSPRCEGKLTSPQSMQDFFITALVRAGTCSAHSKWAPPSRSVSTFPINHHKARRKGLSRVPTTQSVHSKHPNDKDQELPSPIPEISKEELRDLVDIYGEWGRRREDLNGIVKVEVSDEPQVIVGPEAIHGIDDAFYFTDNDARVHLDHNIVTENLIHDIHLLLENQDCPPERVFEVYRALPVPRVTYLSKKLLHRLLNHMSIVPRRDETVMLRYLSIIDDMKDARMPISLRDWNTAIHLAGKCLGKITADDVESALSVWKDMENNAGIKGDHVTFSILFDLAVKSEQYVLAEMVQKEAETRGLSFDRISYMAQIYLNGIRGDGIGVRRAYSNLVEAGEIVDTVVLTNVITSLINAGELPAADMTFERMKRLHAEKQGATIPPDDWREERALQDILREAAARYRQDSEGRLNFQEATPIAPNWQTYRAFIRHHAEDSANYDQMIRLVDEMQYKGLRLNGAVYYWIFRGFANHGGVRYSAWGRARLEKFWIEFLKASAERSADTFLAHGLAMVVVRAFARCAGKQRAEEVWTEMRSRFEPSHDTMHAVNGILERQRATTAEGESRWKFR